MLLWQTYIYIYTHTCIYIYIHNPRYSMRIVPYVAISGGDGLFWSLGIGFASAHCMARASGWRSGHGICQAAVSGRSQYLPSYCGKNDAQNTKLGHHSSPDVLYVFGCSMFGSVFEVVSFSLLQKGLLEVETFYELDGSRWFQMLVICVSQLGSRHHMYLFP